MAAPWEYYAPGHYHFWLLSPMHLGVRHDQSWAHSLNQYFEGSWAPFGSMQMQAKKCTISSSTWWLHVKVYLSCLLRLRNFHIMNDTDIMPDLPLLLNNKIWHHKFQLCVHSVLIVSSSLMAMNVRMIVVEDRKTYLATIASCSQRVWTSHSPAPNPLCCPVIRVFHEELMVQWMVTPQGIQKGVRTRGVDECRQTELTSFRVVWGKLISAYHVSIFFPFPPSNGIKVRGIFLASMCL